MRGATAILCATLAAGCVPMHSVTTITKLREQDALVMPPEAPLGFGAALPIGGSSLTAGAAFTDSLVNQRDDVGQRALPLSGLIRGAVAASDTVELTVSGSVASPDIDLDPFVAAVDGRKGWLGRGAVGLRMFVPFEESPVQWGWSVDFGGEVSHLIRTDTTTTEVQVRRHQYASQEVEETYFMRRLPHVRIGSVVRVPMRSGATLVGGAQLQTAPSYWASRTEIETCEQFRTGYEDCSTEGEVDVRPSTLVAVLQPTAGVSVPVGKMQLLAQVYANVGSDPSLLTVPFGGALTLESFGRPANHDDEDAKDEDDERPPEPEASSEAPQ